MQLSLKVKDPNANYISHLIAKNPNNLYERKEKGGVVRIVYTRNEEHEVNVLFFVTVDNIELTKNNTNFSSITHYINDRESAISSIFCTLLRKAVGTALNGKPKEDYQEWVDYYFPIEVSFGPVSTSLKEKEIRDLFLPIGYEVEIEYGKAALPESFGKKSSAKFITLKGKQTIQHCFQHLFVLIPVLDQYKHYFIDEKEVEKLKRYGEGWLENHPQRDFVIKESLIFSEIIDKAGWKSNQTHTPLELVEKKKRLNTLRYEKITEVVSQLPNKKSIVDFGAGEGKLAAHLGFLPEVTKIIAVEPSEKEQIKAQKRLEKLVRKPGFKMPSIKWGSLFYYDSSLEKKDVFILCEVIEHIDENRLHQVFNTIFSKYQPMHVIITTPNQDYNAVYDMKESKRHSDHRFEWTQIQFSEWTSYWQDKMDYHLETLGIGEYIEGYGYPTQMAIFSRRKEEGNEENYNTP